MSHTSQRAAQKADTRARIIDGFVVQLAAGIGDTSIERLAEAVGVSPRTVYVHFPDRAALIAALDERFNRELLLQPEYASAEDFVSQVGREFRDASDKADLVRAQLNSRVGREIRGVSRRERSERVRQTLAPLLGGLPPEEADEALAVILLLRGIDTWRILHDELGLDAESGARAVEWALSALLADLRRPRRGAARRRRR